MEYSLGKWLERVDQKLDIILQLNGVDPNTLEAIDQTTQPPEEPEETIEEEPQQTQEDIDAIEPQAQTQKDLQTKEQSIRKAMNRQGGKSLWQG